MIISSFSRLRFLKNTRFRQHHGNKKNYTSSTSTKSDFKYVYFLFKKQVFLEKIAVFIELIVSSCPIFDKLDVL
jgi:hypothetical protein